MELEKGENKQMKKDLARGIILEGKEKGKTTGYLANKKLSTTS